MVPEVEHDGVVLQSRVLQLLEPGPDLGVHLGDLVVVLGPVLAHLGVVGVIGGNSDLGGVVHLLVGALADLALVAGGVVEDGEEGLALGAVLPVALAAALVPDVPFLAQVVVLLGTVGAVVAELAQVGGVHLVGGRQTGHAAHVLGSGRGWIHARYDGGAGRGADGGVGDGPGVDHSLCYQGVEVGGVGVLVPVASQMRPIVLAGYPEDVGQVGAVGSDEGRE